MKITIKIHGTDEGIGASTIRDMVHLVGNRFGSSEEPEPDQECMMGEWEGYDFSYWWEND